MEEINKDEAYVAGFDGGGSKARLIIAAQDGTIVFRQDGAGICAIDNPQWQTEYEKLFIQAENYVKSIKSACFGLAGWGEVPSLDKQVSCFLHHHLPCSIEIMNDVELAHYAAFDEGTGILLLSGTGSMAVSRDRHKNFIRVGGFGHLIGDEGSAYWIGQRALVRLAREIDGREPATAFGNKLSRHLGTALTLEGIMAWIEGGQHQRSHIAKVSMMVDEIAESGDGLAQDLLVAAARELFTAWKAVKAKLDSQDKTYPWAMIGSTFRSKTICRTIRNLIGYDATIPAQSAVDKALRMALSRLSFQ